MEFRILGPLEVRDGDRLLPLGGPRQKAVLAVLLTRANEVVSAEKLIDELWGDEPPGTAANVLQSYVSHLRKELGPDVLLTRAPGYLVQIEPDQLDLHRFERLLDEARAESPEQAAVILREALALWRGPALADFAYEAFAHAEIVRLEELRLAALERRIEADLALGRHAELVGELEGLVVRHPLRERFRGQHMLALYRSASTRARPCRSESGRSCARTPRSTCRPSSSRRLRGGRSPSRLLAKHRCRSARSSSPRRTSRASISSSPSPSRWRGGRHGMSSWLA